MDVRSHWCDAIAAWTVYLQLRGLSEHTIRLRRDHLGFIASRATCGPANLTEAELTLMLSGRRLSSEYLRSFRASACQFWAWGLSAGVLDRDITGCLPKVRAHIPAPRPVTDDVWTAALESADPRSRLALRLAAEAGLRRAESACLHSDDLTYDTAGWSLIIRGKGDKQRVVPITYALAETLRELPHGYVFPGRTDGHISPAHLGELVSDLMPKGWSMHKLRHRYASRGYAATHDLRAVQEALGHASVATTQRYTAVSRDDVRRISEAASRATTG